MKRYEECRESLQRALDVDPEHAPAHFNLAGTLAVQGKLNEAIASYRTAAAGIWSKKDDKFSRTWSKRANARIKKLTKTLKEK